MSAPLTTPSPALGTSAAADTDIQAQYAQPLANPIALALHNDIDACQNPDQLHAITKLLWERYSLGQLNDYEASYIQSCIERRRPVSRRTKLGKFAVLNFRHSRFFPRQRPRSPNRQASRDRRRRLGGSSALPDTLRHYYTEGQRAVLCIVAGEIKHHGVCDLPIDKIAALAGVCRTTVQTTLHEAHRLGHIRITERPVPGRKNLTNVVEIVSKDWRAWIARAPSAHRPGLGEMGVDNLKHRGGGGRIGSNSVKMVSTTKSKDLNKEEALQEMRGYDPPRREGRTRGGPS